MDRFISFLQDDVKIIKELPSEGRESVIPYSIRVPRKCTPECYEKRVLPHLVKRNVSVKMLDSYNLICLFFTF